MANRRANRVFALTTLMVGNVLAVDIEWVQIVDDIGRRWRKCLVDGRGR